MNGMLENTSTYENLRRYPTEDKKNKLKALQKLLPNTNR